ncbi:hypothetical protein [Micromonospora sp. 4G55]|uniref:hypothetical protein n=1 Tax=Micromonospora sp. 4G55 TaxID=2806102 RepID=UPI001A5B5261|nr:hypothetical protein [Micromonospora sp. 4G55]MBM0257679.1 hypothetical protein [Micromonospora sp. 4G55]
MTDPTDQTWTLYRGDELIAALVINGGDFPWLEADVQPYAGLADVRPLVDEEVRLLDDVDNHVGECGLLLCQGATGWRAARSARRAW